MARLAGHEEHTTRESPASSAVLVLFEMPPRPMIVENSGPGAFCVTLNECATVVQ
jgi:hypothetical protein